MPVDRLAWPSLISGNAMHPGGLAGIARRLPLVASGLPGSAIVAREVDPALLAPWGVCLGFRWWHGDEPASEPGLIT